MRLAATQKQGALLYSFLVLPLLAPLYSSALHTTVHNLSSCSKDPLLELPGALDILRAFCSMNGSRFAKSRKDLIQAPPYLACLWDHLFSCFPLILNYNRAASCISFSATGTRYRLAVWVDSVLTLEVPVSKLPPCFQTHWRSPTPMANSQTPLEFLLLPESLGWLERETLAWRLAVPLKR